MLGSVKLVCAHASCRDHPVHWTVVKAITSVSVLVAILAPRDWAVHTAVAANLFWIWVDA